jgi:predicted nucleic acid-binding protein
MFMNNKIFFDSSTLIEYRKGNHIDFFENIVGNSLWFPCISQIVVSEYLFHHLGVFGGKSPLSIKMSNGVKSVIAIKDPTFFLAQFEWLQDHPTMGALSIKLMEAYNLLPNDALILSICKTYEIKFLASHDSDFKDACSSEGIVLFGNFSELSTYENSL